MQSDAGLYLYPYRSCDLEDTAVNSNPEKKEEKNQDSPKDDSHFGCLFYA